MSIYQFIQCAAVMRTGGICVIGCPPRYHAAKAKAHRHEKLNAATTAGLWGFRIKHPDFQADTQGSSKSWDINFHVLRQGVEL